MKKKAKPAKGETRAAIEKAAKAIAEKAAKEDKPKKKGVQNR